MPVTLTYSELVDGLRELIRRAEPAKLSAEIRIVGGTAVARLRPDTERRTQDVDAYIRATDADRAALDAIVVEIGNERGWEPDWLNSKATMFLPVDGEPHSWQPLCSGGGVDVWIAPPDLVLAMKLRSNRGRRDTRDLPVLIEALRLTTRAQIEALFERFFPYDETISARCADWLDHNGYPAVEPTAIEWRPPVASRRVWVEEELGDDGNWIPGYWTTK